MADLSVAGRIYRDGKLAPGILHIDTETGLIEKIGKSGKAREHMDLGDQAILPGAIDLHVHFRDPGATHKEDWQTGSVSAAFGGVTTVVDMPNTAPPTITYKALRDKLETAAKRSVVDFAAWSGATWYLDDLPRMLQHTPGIKIYLGATTGDLLMEEGDRVRKAIEIAGAAGKTVVLHCEAQRVLKQMRGTEEVLADHDTMRPPVAEVEAIYDVMKALPGIRQPPRIHIAHIASVEALQAAEAAKFSRGVCPHHLLLDVEHCCDADPGHGKMNPPLRRPHARQALWDAFVAGRMPILESDHAPHSKAEKAGPFHNAPSGVPGVETMLPLLLARAVAGHVELGLVVDAATQGPAALLGLKDRGRLAAGMRADFAVYDLDTMVEVEAGRLHSKCGWTPFEGHNAVFPAHTFLAGQPVVADGDLVAEPGTGRPLYPMPEA